MLGYPPLALEHSFLNFSACSCSDSHIHQEPEEPDLSQFPKEDGFCPAHCKILILVEHGAALVSSPRMLRVPSLCWDQRDTALDFLSLIIGMIRVIHLSLFSGRKMVLGIQAQNGVPTYGAEAVSLKPSVVNIISCQSPLVL